MERKSIEILQYSFSDDLNHLLSLLGNTIFNVRADGTMMAGTSLNFFYLFVPWADEYQHSLGGRIHPSAATITTPAYVSAENLDTIKVHSWEVSAYNPNNIALEEVCYGYYKYKVSMSPNPSTLEREDNIEVLFTVAALVGDIATSDHSITHETVTVSFKIKLSGLEAHDEPSTSNNYYYRVDTQLTNLDAPLTLYSVIKAFPQTLSDGYSRNSSEVSNINAFKYVYVRTIDTSAEQLTGYSKASWARLTLVTSLSNPCVKVFQIEADQNNSGFSRSTVLSIKKDGITIVNIHIIQYAVDNPLIPSIPVDAEEAEDKYWEGEGTTGSFIITDTNEGAIIDSTQLLFKSNYANIYNTIELKDGTLFLGNYINENTINNVHDIMNLYIATDKIAVADGTRRVPVNLSGASDYSYIPDMTQNSQLKRIFKYGETYALGLVFVYKTGTWSSVYYLGENREAEDLGKWEVSNPLLEPSLVSLGGEYYYNKPVRYCVLSEEVTNALAALGVIAVIPVYAVKNSHRIMCLGFLSPTLKSSTRTNAEAILAQYSWFYRNSFTVTLPDALPSGLLAASDLIEIQNLEAAINSLADFNNWEINRQICSLNTPEVEADEVLSDAMLLNAQCRSVRNYTGFKYVNGFSLSVNGKYLKSYFSSANVFGDNRPISSITERRVITGYLWHGFRNNGFNSKDGTLLDESNKEENYLWFAVYPWLRAIIGGEGPTSSIINKRLFNSLYLDGTTIDSSPLNLPDVVDAAIYRDFDTASIIRVDSDIYQGNTDYIAVTEQANAYKAWTSLGRSASEGQPTPYPHAHKDDGNYANYDVDGYITDPISIKYKTAPHIAIKFNDVVTYKDKGVLDYLALFCVELLNPTDSKAMYKTDTLDLQGYQWIKCGDLKRILPTEQTIVMFEEGDYFYGRFDSLRTYCYTEEDVNSVVEVVSGMLCSRVNLDSRCDRNRGVRTPTVTPENFNIFNPVYNQLNNYFTFSYINQGDIIYRRKYGNSIQWSLTKEYSADIDNWCNILDINTLDFDGDKGEIQSITKLGNNLIVFQDTGISLIQYNEKTLIATDLGVPIEIGNSNKVDGKYYLYDNVGCQYKGSISKSPNGIYFVDSINRTLYLLGLNAQLNDLCTVGGMKSWGLSNLDRSWWSYYDINSQEVLFVNDIEALAYSDAYGRFNAFLGYGGIRWNFRINDRTVLICPTNFTLVISTTSPTVNSNKRVIKETVKLENVYNSFWKKNSIDNTCFFGNYSPIEILLQCNPEPTIDKTFCVVEYRMDCFDAMNQYLPEMSFNTFRAWNEYQDTLETSLKYRENQEGPVYSNVYSTRLRKKFRIWRLDIPRAYYGNTLDLTTQLQNVPDLNDIVPALTNINGLRSGRYSMDRIRNPWCNIYFKLNTEGINKVIFNDLSIHYFK